MNSIFGTSSTFAFVACATALAWGCGGSDDRSSSSSGSSDAATTGAGGAGGATTGTTTTSGAGGDATATTASGQGGGAPLCGQGMIDTPCEECGATKCMAEAQGCAMASQCDDQGNVTGGCLAFVQCAVEKCAGDLACVLQMCSTELQEAGGVGSPAVSAAQALGDCVGAKCMAECAQ